MFVQELFESVLRLPGEFAGVAAHDPLSAVLMAIGALIVFGTVGYVGYLVLGAVADLLNPSSGGEPRQPGR
jgi:hypothetical protein